jgi:subtilisin family serine protease
MIAARGGKEKHIYGALGGFAVSGISNTAAEELARDPNVRLIERDGVDHPSYTQILPPGGSAAALWHLDRIDKFGALAYDDRFNYDHTGAGTHIYILDSGVRASHTEFTGRIGNGACFLTPSWGCSQNNDPASHGTAMASVAAGTIHGVAKLATIHSVRIVDDDDNAVYSDVVAGFNWVLQNRQLPAVANYSLGSVEGSFAVRDAIEQLIVGGNVLVFKAAGNDNVDAFMDRGNRAPSAVIVGATDATDARAPTSNWGPTVTLMAPGFVYEAASSVSTTSVVLVSGTSPASALAAGAAAAILSSNSGLTHAQLKAALLNGASPVTISNGLGVANRVLFSRITPPANIVASISGPTSVLPGVYCRYVASATGAPGPYSYSWTVNGTPTGGNVGFIDVTNSGTPFDVSVVISAPGANPGSTFAFVYVSGSAEPCDE